MNKEELKQLAKNTANIDSIKEDVKFVRSQVTNHIPTAIGVLRADMEKRDREQVERSNKNMVALAGITSTVVVLSQIAFYFMTK